MQATKKAPSENTAHRSAKRVAIILTIFPFARMNATLFAHFESLYCTGIFIVHARFEVNQADKSYFQGRDKNNAYGTDPNGIFLTQHDI
jgi:hypothetical protein